MKNTKHLVIAATALLGTTAAFTTLRGEDQSQASTKGAVPPPTAAELVRPADDSPSDDPVLDLVAAHKKMMEDAEGAIRSHLPPHFEAHPFSRVMRVEPAEYQITFSNPKGRMGLPVFLTDQEEVQWVSFAVFRGQTPKVEEGSEEPAVPVRFEELYTIGAFNPEDGQIRLLDVASGLLHTPTEEAPTIIGMVD